jgi:hypothetical protein
MRKTDKIIIIAFILIILGTLINLHLIPGTDWQAGLLSGTAWGCILTMMIIEKKQ